MFDIFAIEPLPIELSSFLKYGAIGLAAILALLCFWLLRGEQVKSVPRTPMLVSIYIFMFFSLLLFMLGLLSKPEIQKVITGYVVPHQVKEKVKVLPPETSGKYVLYKDISIFDLRGWKPVPPERMNEEYSPANYINYLHIKKTQPL